MSAETARFILKWSRFENIFAGLVGYPVVADSIAAYACGVERKYAAIAITVSMSNYIIREYFGKNISSLEVITKSIIDICNILNDKPITKSEPKPKGRWDLELRILSAVSWCTTIAFTARLAYIARG